jgi:hypothetical protein
MNEEEKFCFVRSRELSSSHIMDFGFGYIVCVCVCVQKTLSDLREQHIYIIYNNTQERKRIFFFI